MPKINHGVARQARQSQQVTASRKRQLSATVQRALQFRRDVFRGGSPFEILRLLDEPPHPDPLMDESPATEPEDDTILPSVSEILLADEDEGEDEESSAEVTMSRDGPDSAIESSYWDRIVIPVVGSRAVFQIPDWALAIENDDLNLRWETYAKLAEWLFHERTNFLRNPSFLALAGSPVRLTPPIPVLQEGLHQTLGLHCDVTTFSKHARHGILVWPGRECPIEDMWSQDAKMGWCAHAAIQRQKERGYAPRESDLGMLDIQPPRDAAERKRLRAEADRGWQLGPVRFVQLLCVLTDCRWRDVLQRYGDTIFDQG